MSNQADPSKLFHSKPGVDEKLERMKGAQIYSAYDEQADKFLSDNFIRFYQKFLGDGCPPWEMDNKHIHGDKYRITFKRDGKKPLSVFFWNSLHDKQNQKEPSAYSVLACLTKNDPGSFDNFCGDFGYDSDSMRALKTYRAVVKQWGKVKEFLLPGELEALQEIQ